MRNRIFKYSNKIGAGISIVLLSTLLPIKTAAQLQPLEPQQNQSTPDLEKVTANPVVSFEVDRSGRPINLTIVDSSGDEQLDAIAISLVEQWRFDPNSAQPLQTYTATVNLDLEQNLADNQYPAYLVDTYMEGCTRGDVELEPFCQCTIANIQQNVPLDEFIAISLAIEEDPEGEAAEQLDPIFTEAFTSCIDQAPESIFESE